MEFPEGESRVTKVLKGFFEREWKRIHSVEAWQISHHQGDGWQCKGIVPSSNAYDNGRPQSGLHVASCKYLFSVENIFGHF